MIRISFALPVSEYPDVMERLLKVIVEVPLIVDVPVKLTVPELWLNVPLHNQFPATPIVDDAGPVSVFPELMIRLLTVGEERPLMVVVPLHVMVPPLCIKVPLFIQLSFRIRVFTADAMNVLVVSLVKDPLRVIFASIICLAPAPFNKSLLYVVR